MLMIDIDYFKHLNDRDGHVRGDECLKRVATALATGACRPRDMLARYGGEEFVILLPQTDASGAARVAQRCRMALDAEAIPHASATGAIVTVSIGCGTTVPSEGASATTFLEAVDKCLYKAKDAGRNQLVLMQH
jgi:diguanylate cyclase (GGDEF)-like protein